MTHRTGRRHFQDQEGVLSSDAALATTYGCAPAAADSLRRIKSPGPITKTLAVLLVKVTPDFVGARVEYGDGVRTDKADMQEFAPRYGALRFSPPALSAGGFQHHICYTVPQTSGLRRLIGLLNEWCVPTQPVTFEVSNLLPGRVRLQPGMIVVNRWRDVRLTVHTVFILDRESYFREVRKPRLFGGYLNPTLGLQLGGSDNQLVLLLGGHLRLIEEAGAIFGFRFGDEPSSTR